jgi:hypothetical protein
MDEGSVPSCLNVLQVYLYNFSPCPLPLSRYDGIEAKHKVDEEVQRCAAALRQLSEVEAARARRVGAFGEQRLRLLDGLGGLLALHEDLRGALEGARGPVAQAASFYHRQMAAVAETMVPAGYCAAVPPAGAGDGAQGGLYSSRAVAPNPLGSTGQPPHAAPPGQSDQVDPSGQLRRSVNGGMRPALQLDPTGRPGLLLPQGAPGLYGGAPSYSLVSVHGGLQRRPTAVPSPSVPYIRDSRDRLVVPVGAVGVVPGSSSALYPDRREFVSREVVGGLREYRPNEL